MAVSATENAGLEYMPDYDQYLARVKHRQETEKLDQHLPKGFPASLSGDLVWEGKDLADRYNWNYHLTGEDLDEIEQALQHFKSCGKSMGELTPETFPLPKLHAVLRQISDEVHNGHGFKVVRGLPVDSYTREDNIIVYAGLSSHVAPIRGRQDNKWQGKPADVLVAHVKDLSHTCGSEDIPGPVVTAEKQVFHTDSGDIIALMCLGEGESGGESYIASTCHVYNILAARRPDLIKTLSEPWPFDDFAPSGDQYKLRPLLYYQPATDSDPERLIIQYSRRNLTGYWDCKRSANIPPLSEAQAEALDAIHFTAEQHAISLDFHKGDIQFANNLSILHARGAFTDSNQKQRHLLRLWLRDPEYEWTKPRDLQERFDRVYAGVTVENSVFPLEATIRSKNVAT
ncbi:TfdA family taurine catabolism dioxygenase TauD [Aspergillus avenaceus]|uniref:TfdA family taurine catabolism dioxygenase TauD n=1 Tax=Aspergillus avenaceus TaxID=36643 RepID=A0A5N6TPH3_ASPAV|nr:TfdA family taurine catabolism dioxygenase TauD [Aspergillus avenaceus]